MKKRIRKSTIIVSIILLLVILIILYFVFIYTYKCKTEECFFEKYQKCQRIKYIKDGWEYHVKGIRANNICLAKVTAIAPEGIDLETLKELKNKEMSCYIPLDLTIDTLPQEHIEYCHGELKEAIQEVMIKKMHLYIIENLGQGQDFGV